MTTTTTGIRLCVCGHPYDEPYHHDGICAGCGCRNRRLAPPEAAVSGRVSQRIDAWLGMDTDREGRDTLAYALAMLAKAEWTGVEGDMVIGRIAYGGGCSLTFGVVIRGDVKDGQPCYRWEVHS